MPIAYDNKFTLGNLITIGALIAGLAVGYGTLQQQQANDRARLMSLETTVKDNELTVLTNRREFDERLRQVEREADARLRLLETAQASQSTELRNILIGINEIKTSLAALAREPRL